MSNRTRFKPPDSTPSQDVQPVQVNKPTIQKGNYLIQVISDGREIKQVVAIGAEINIIKLAEDGLAIDLK